MSLSYTFALAGVPHAGAELGQLHLNGTGETLKLKMQATRASRAPHFVHRVLILDRNSAHRVVRQSFARLGLGLGVSRVDPSLVDPYMPCHPTLAFSLSAALHF